ncbi:MAG: peptidoglycan DD-metalloendopeptidase family protein [Nonlabens sp.]|nr:peptidoglycan DD-metalloendopeptidase family protein [Nonlabens sp.]
MKFRPLFIVLMLLCFVGVQAQSEQERLEQRKAAIQREIDAANNLLKKAKKEKSNVLNVVNTINKKISNTQEIITITNKQANSITRNIVTNKQEITKLEAEIKELKAEYADMIVKSYKSNNDQSRLMFLLSSENFLQAYKRVQYLKSYANYRKKQADEIEQKSRELASRTKGLETERERKAAILQENKMQRQELDKDKVEQNSLLAIVKKDESKYAAEIRNKNKERAAIDREIKRLIEADIAASNKGKTGAVAGKFFLTPEAKTLANNFKANRGKLPWPVDKGFIALGYGSQPSPLLPSVQIQSNGLRIQTPEGTVVRAVFEGEVARVVKASNGILTVHVRHGNYTSVYGNLRSVSVGSGDKVSTKQPLGTVFTDREGISELKFVLLQDTSTMNPAQWITGN